MTDQHYSKDNLPAGSYGLYSKRYNTPAVRIDGTFHCLTSEGNLASCTDGWLAVDSRGHPYPINHEEFCSTYVPAEAHAYP